MFISSSGGEKTLNRLTSKRGKSGRRLELLFVLGNETTINLKLRDKLISIWVGRTLWQLIGDLDHDWAKFATKGNLEANCLLKRYDSAVGFDFA